MRWLQFAVGTLERRGGRPDQRRAMREKRDILWENSEIAQKRDVRRDPTNGRQRCSYTGDRPAGRQDAPCARPGGAACAGLLVSRRTPQDDERAHCVQSVDECFRTTTSIRSQTFHTSRSMHSAPVSTRPQPTAGWDPARCAAGHEHDPFHTKPKTSLLWLSVSDVCSLFSRHSASRAT